MVWKWYTILGSNLIWYDTIGLVELVVWWTWVRTGAFIESSHVFSKSFTLLFLPKCSTPNMSSFAMDVLFIFASSIALYFFPALCHIKLNGQSFFDPEFADVLQKSTLPKTTATAGPWQTDRREASGFEKHYCFYVFHVQQADFGTIFTGSPLAENLEYVRVRIWLNSPREAVESVNTILNAELKGFDVSKQKDGPLRGFTSRPNVSKWTKTQNTTTSGSHIRDIYKSIYLYIWGFLKIPYHKV